MLWPQVTAMRSWRPQEEVTVKTIRRSIPALAVLATLTLGAAQGESVGEVAFALDTLFMLLAAILVAFMQPGFALLEAGLHSSKNVINIFMKNVADFAVAGLAFWAVGFGIMYGAGWFLSGYTNDSVAVSADFFFQMVFAATAATIVSGAIGGRMKFGAYLIFSVVMTGLIYPFMGQWQWGGGWLSGWSTLRGKLRIPPRLGVTGFFAALERRAACGPALVRGTAACRDWARPRPACGR